MKQVKLLISAGCWIVIFTGVLTLRATAQHGGYRLRVEVRQSDTELPVGFASLSLSSDKQTLPGSCNASGIYTFEHIEGGSYTLQVFFLGYKTYSVVLPLHQDRSWAVQLQPDAFHLNEVVVTASESKGMSSSSTIDRQAMEHLQPSNVGDLMSLLPGERTQQPVMGAANLIRLREAGGNAVNNSSGSSYDISSFGTSFLIDGVPLSTKSNMQYILGNTSNDIDYKTTANRGVDMRSLPTDEIEHIEVVRGIASVEYGDLTSGLVKIERRQGGNDYQARFKADASSKLLYIGKGIEWRERHLSLNAGVDFMDSKADPRNPLENYKRLTGSLRLSKRWESDKGYLTYTSSLDYGGSFDNMKIDPDINFHKEDRYRSSYNRFALTNKLAWRMAQQGFFRSVELTTSVNLEKNTIERTRYVQLSHPTPTPPVSQEEGVHDGTFLTPQYVATGGVEGSPFTAFAKLITHFQLSTASLSHAITAGVDWQMNKNYGQGQIYDPLYPLQPGITTRPRPYYDIPAGHDFSLFVEDNTGVPVGRHRLDIQAGLRATTLFNLSNQYTLHGKFYLDPRINLRWVFPQVQLAARPLQLEIGGGVGWHTMMPSLSMLYPDPIYYDLTQLSYYHSNPAYRRLNLKTYLIDPTNYSLGAARNFKWEVRTDWTYAENRLSLTFFREQMTSGFRTGQRYQIFAYRQYDASGLDPDLLTAPPDIATLPHTQKQAFGLYSTSTNGTHITKEGVEYQYTSPRIRSLRTRITIDGAWLRTTYSDSEPFYKVPSVNLGDENYPYIGYYEDPSGYRRESLNTRFMFDTYLPKLKLGFSAAVECMWYYRSEQLRQSGVPLSYIDFNGVSHPYTEASQQDAYLQWLVTSYNEALFKTRILEPLNVGVNLKVTKKLYGERLQLALFVNQLFSHYHEYEANGVTIRQIGTMPYFGMEINFSLKK